ncbi:MAG TPA: peptidoglycan-associated lipoprotein Pal [Allosphingosinicella sp.]|jgi:peptidoglycan-associated lipoprotein
MRQTPWKVAAIAAALALTAGCGKKAPKELPPAPQEETGGETSGAGEDASAGGVGTEALPGSREAFLQAVGMGGDRVFFDTDQYDLDDRDRATLDAQAGWLQSNPRVRVTIEGHADERGTRDYNLALGDRRANAAKNYLAARGVSPSRMTVISYGKERPEALGSDETAWAQNRRAVTVLPE